MYSKIPGVGVAGGILQMIEKCLWSSKVRSVSAHELSVSLKINVRCNITSRLSSGSKSIPASKESEFFSMLLSLNQAVRTYGSM